LLTVAIMPTVTPTSSQRTPSDDALRTDRAARDEAGQPKPSSLRAEPVDPEDDPYDNVACTD
jgi:hypothetical protein